MADARRTRSRAVAAVLVACALVALFVAFRVQASRKMPDFEVYWRAGGRAAGAEPLYRASDQHYQLKYLPAFAVLAIPASFVPLGTAKALWFTASVAMLAGLLALGMAMLPERRRSRWLLVLLAIVAMGKFYGHELVLGQVNLLFGVLIAGAVVLLRTRQEVTAGLLIALAVVVKPYAVIFLPWLAAVRRAKAAGIAVAGLLVMLALPAALYGMEGTIALHRDWWTTVTTSTNPNLLNQDNVSVAAMFAKWLGPGSAASRLAAVTSIALLAAAGWMLRSRSRLAFPEGLEAATLLALIPLLSPQGWDYVFLLATPAVMFLVNYGDALPGVLRTVAFAALATAGLSLFDTMGRENYAAFMALSIISLCFLVVVAALGVLRARRVA